MNGMESEGGEEPWGKVRESWGRVSGKAGDLGLLDGSCGGSTYSEQRLELSSPCASCRSYHASARIDPFLVAGMRFRTVYRCVGARPRFCAWVHMSLALGVGLAVSSDIAARLRQRQRGYCAALTASTARGDRAGWAVTAQAVS